jgi:TetR/AcrR family transcriptional regulator of autoinduction and epiphytic fitness
VGEVRGVQLHPPSGPAEIPSKGLDGRQARSLRTREAIAEALLDLIEGGNFFPSTSQIAEQAGVSERSVYHHFSERSELIREVASRQFQRVLRLVEDIDPEAPLEVRLDCFVREMVRILRSLAPVKRLALALEPTIPEIREARGRFVEAARGRVRSVFARELAQLSPLERDRLVALVCAVLSSGAWEELVFQGMAEMEVVDLFKLALDSILSKVLARAEGRGGAASGAL